MILRIATFLLFALLAVALTQACSPPSAEEAPSDEALRAEVVAALDALAAELAAERPADAAAYEKRLQSHLEAHPAFFGSAAALLDRAGRVIASPYVYRAGEGYATLDLATPSYNVDVQAWVTEPLEQNAGTWTEPYFDAGGGEIWMVTRSVPVSDANGVFAIVTTDLPVDAPAQ